MPSRAWKTTEVLSVIRQVNEKKKLSEIKIEGRTLNSINGVLVNLRKSGRLHDRPTRAIRAWTQKSILRLKELVAQGNSANKIAQGNLLGTNRTANSISQQMRRLELGDPKVREMAKKAKRLPKEKAKRLEVLLRGPGKTISTKRIAKAWGIRPEAVTGRRRKLKVTQSWYEARKESARFAKMNSV